MESISDISGTTSYSTNTKFFCIITILNDYYYFFHAYRGLLFLEQWWHCWDMACAATADESIQWFPFTNVFEILFVKFSNHTYEILYFIRCQKFF